LYKVVRKFKKIIQNNKMDIENSRKELVIPGYEHPSSENSSRDKRYKTFDETEKKKKKNMDKFQGTNVRNQYATYTMTDEEVETCPSCDAHPISTCPCGYSDKTCSNGHTWYTDRKGDILIGNPHKQV
jgi:hypothetical protein